MQLLLRMRLPLLSYSTVVYVMTPDQLLLCRRGRLLSYYLPGRSQRQLVMSSYIFAAAQTHPDPYTTEGRRPKMKQGGGFKRGQAPKKEVRASH